MIERFRTAWNNAYYRWYGIYVSIIVTLIFGFQMYKYFFADTTTYVCPTSSGSLSLIPVIGVFFDG